MASTSSAARASAARSALSRPLPASAAAKLPDLAEQVAERLALVPDDLAEVQVQALDRGGALVQAVDLRVPDVLLDRVVLQVAGAAEGLQRQGQHLVGALGADALDDRQQQVVDGGGRSSACRSACGGLQRVLEGRGVQDERPHALGVRLLQHQHPADVRVVDDRDPRRGLVGQLGEVGALHPGPGVVQGVQVAGRQRRDRLGADHHPGVLDDHEHLPDAVVHVADQGADRGTVTAEGQLAGGGRLQAHLVLDVGRVDAVALAQLAVRRRPGTWAPGTSTGPWCPGPRPRAGPAPGGRCSPPCRARRW